MNYLTVLIPIFIFLTLFPACKTKNELTGEIRQVQQWKINTNEEGWPDWANAHASRRNAIDLPGSIYPGIVGKIIRELDLADIERHSFQGTDRYYLAKPGKLYVCYIDKEKEIRLHDLKTGMTYRWFDPETGEITAKETVADVGETFKPPSINPMVLVITR